MAEDKSKAHGDHAHDDHGGVGKYVAVFLVLCVLTGASFMTYFPFWHDHIPQPVSRTFMMAVSCMKALLVMGFFMHLIWEANWKFVLTIPAGMMSIFLILMLVPDIGCRYQNYSEERLLHAADPNTGTIGHGGGHGHSDDGHSEGGHSGGEHGEAGGGADGHGE